MGMNDSLTCPTGATAESSTHVRRGGTSAIEVVDLAEPRSNLSDTDVRAIRELRLSRLGPAEARRQRAEGMPSELIQTWRELDWAVVDLCDLALMGNEGARSKLVAIMRGLGPDNVGVERS